MTAGLLIPVDLLVASLTAVGWLGAGAAAAARRRGVALALLAAAVPATLARGVTVAALAGAGWWFVEEKVLVALPLLGVTGAVAVALAGPRLLRRDGDGTGPAGVVALFTAGYAAVAGLGLTFLFGYPATWAKGLITVALVAAGALVTWRVLTPAPAPVRPRLGAAALALGLAGVGMAVVPGQSADLGGGPAAGHQGTHGVPITSLRGPAEPLPGGAVRRFALAARTATLTLSSGRRIEAWTYNGQVPGPALTARQGDLIEVTLHNEDIASGVTLHWHGYDVPAGEDGAPGVTQDAVPPGGRFVYRFQALQAGTYWYHTHQVSHEGVRKGLYGTLVVTPREPAASPGVDLTLPVHTFGDAVTIGRDDRPITRRVAPGTPVRLRLVNTDSVPRRFAPAGTAYRLVAVDGRDLNEPGEVTRTALVLAAGGRYDLAFTMPAGPVSLVIGDRILGLRLTTGGSADTSGTPATSGWPELDLTRYGTPAPTSIGSGSRFDRRFTLVLDRGIAPVDGIPQYAQTVGGRAFPSIPGQLVRENDLVRITVVNRGLEVHPWHLHGHAVLVLSRNGRPATGSPLWLDTFDVRPGEVWEVALRAANPGVWMNHCHNLEHAEQGMVLHLSYDGVTTPLHGGHIEAG